MGTVLSERCFNVGVSRYRIKGKHTYWPRLATEKPGSEVPWPVLSAGLNWQGDVLGNLLSSPDLRRHPAYKTQSDSCGVYSGTIFLSFCLIEGALN